LLAITFQDASGYWHVPPDQSADAAAGTVSVATSHFSDWSLLQDVQIQPSSASVRNDTSQALSLIVCLREEQAMQSDGPRYICREGESRRYAVSAWMVNGITGGNATLGTIASAGPGSAIFQAPHRAPKPNTVQVAAELHGGTAKALVFASVTIYDASFTADRRWEAVIKSTHPRTGADRYSYHETVTMTGTMVRHEPPAHLSETGQ